MTVRRPLAPPVYVDDANRLRQLVQDLAQEPLLALDTESNSLYAYRERVCLIQVSSRARDYIIDPLRIKDMKPFGELLMNPHIEKVFHAAEYDLMCMKRDFGFGIINLFDTMLAARICGYKQVGLGALLGEFLGVALDKSHQRDDWGKRPLPAASLLYAQMDTHYLPALRDHFVEELERFNAWTEAKEAFEDACDVPAARHPVFDPEAYWRIALPNQLTRRQAAILRELYLLREDVASKRNLPPFKILSDKLLAALALNAPANLVDLTQVNGMSHGLVRRYARSILEAVERGQRAKLPPPPTPEPPLDPAVVERYTALREWRKHRAMKRGVESDVIISKDALWTLAERAPRSIDAMHGVPGFGPWRLNMYGAEILEVISRYP